MNSANLARALLDDCRRFALVAIGLLVLASCARTSAPPPPAAGEEKSSAAAEAGKPAAGWGVTLTPQQIEKLGLKTQDLKATEFGAEAEGFGTVIPHETLAQAAAELVTAQAAEKQSHAALERSQRLAGTAGALSADVADANARQAAVDAAALTLAKQRLSGTFGQKPPWADGQNPALLEALAGGAAQLVRVTFPLGALPAQTPKSLRATRIGAAGTASWSMTVIWAAPADANVPGRSFFAVLRDSDVSEGERIVVWAPLGTRRPGFLVPRAAVVISDGKSWCYRETKPGHFTRTQIDTSAPFNDGYFVTDGVVAGDRVVIAGAAQLLAQESNSGADAD